MPANTDVKVFQSTDAGAPTLSGTAGHLIAALTGCLQDGYGSVTLDSISIAGGVATCTKSAGHGFTAIGNVGPVVRVSGTTVQTGTLDGDYRATISSTTVFTVETTASGTVSVAGSAKRAPAGFSAAFSGTNKAAYRSDDVTGTRLYLRAADDGTGSATYARVRGYETMSDVDTGTGPFPTDDLLSGGGYWGKSSTANGTAREWRIFADPQGFVLAVRYDGNYWIGNWAGDLISAKAADLYRFLLTAGANTTIANMGYLFLLTSNAGQFMPRGYLGTGTAIQPYKYSHYKMSTGLGYAGSDYPALPGGQFYAAPVDVWDSASVLRGILPGVYGPIHPATSLTDGTPIDNVTGLTGRTLFIQRMVNGGSSFAAAIDITGPWR